MAGSKKSASARTQGRAEEPKPPFPAQHQRAPGLEAKLHPQPRWQAARYRAAGKLEGKVALITGGDSGIGRAVACLYAREGADIAIVYLPREQRDADATRRTIEALGRRCLLLPSDITELSACQEAVTRTVKELGQLDILVSNAAHQVRSEKLEDVSEAQFDLTYKTNIYAYYRLVKAALPHLKRGAAIIATSSVTGILGTENLPEYSSTKGAINAFTKTLGMDLIKRGIRVNAVAPGPVWTPLNPSDAGKTAKEVAHFGSDSPMGRPAQPEELAPAYVFLASEADSSYITGTVLQVMGGETAGG
ncbi:MAG: short-chain dehydrogenase [Verrucomicrobia bacterium]|nr:short-chain dehydrogenase [Verrucomicrobiota bacterium]